MKHIKLLSLFPRIIFLLIIISANHRLVAQNVIGKLVDQNGNGLSGLQLKLYISPKTYDATSTSDGTFTFTNITDVKDNNELPSGYAVSGNYPNPFNPKTRMGITLPNSGSVQVGVYNLIGQKVLEEIERYYSAGTNFIDLELNGLPNGFYIARIILDGRYLATRKMMLMYGSQHLSSAGSGNSYFSQLNKTTVVGHSSLNTKIDSLVVTGSTISKKSFTNLPSMIGSSLNLGNLVINLPAPNVPILSSPFDAAVDVPLSPILYWNLSNTATSYSLQISTNISFSNYIFNQVIFTPKGRQFIKLV